MKKILTILLLLFIVNISFAQVKVGSEGNIIPTGIYPAVKAHDVKGTLHYFKTLVERNALPANFRDTGMLAYVGDSAKFYYLNNSINNTAWTEWQGSGGGGGSGCTTSYVTSDSLYLVRDSCGTLDSTQIVGDGSGGGGIANIKTTQDITLTTSGDTSIIGRLVPNGLITPGIVTWSGSGLIMDVASPEYYFNQNYFNPSSTQITLDAADGTNPRFDVIYVDSSGNIGKITGIASATPIIPQVDPQSQILLSAIYLAAGATTPTNINETLIYDENVEWTTSKTGTGTVDFNDVTNPYHSTKDIKVTTSSAGMSLVFTSPTTDSASIGDVLKFFLYTATPLTSGYKFQFFAGTNPVSTALSINSIGYGYNPNNLNTYQNISIPFAAFTFYSPEYNILKITNLGTNVNPIYFDYISIQKGNYNFAPTDYSNKVDSTTISGGNEYWWSKGIPHLAGSVGGATPSLQDVTDVGYVTTNPIVSSFFVSAGSIDGTTNQIALCNCEIGNPTIQYKYPTTSTEMNLVADSLTEGLARVLHLPDNNGTLIATINGEHPTSDGNINISSGIDSTTASNGLTMVGKDVQLGGALAKNTTIYSPSYDFKINGTSDTTNNNVLFSFGVFPGIFTSFKNSTNQGFASFYPSGNQLYSKTSLGKSAQIDTRSDGSNGSDSVFARMVATNVTTTSTMYIYPSYIDAVADSLVNFTIFKRRTPISGVATVMKISRTNGGSAGYDGIGLSLDLINNNIGNTATTSTKIISKLITALNSAEVSQFQITGLNVGAVDTLFTLNGNGSAKLNQYGQNLFTGTLAKSLGVDASGNVIEINTPLVTTGTAAPSSTPTKVGDIFVDTTNKKLYFATGTASSADWTIAN